MDLPNKDPKDDLIFWESMEQLASETALSSKSPLMTEEKFQAIRQHLLHPSDKVDTHFKHWVKKRQFQLMDLPGLGLNQVLVLPNDQKSKVSCSYTYIL